MKSFIFVIWILLISCCIDDVRVLLWNSHSPNCLKTAVTENNRLTSFYYFSFSQIQPFTNVHYSRKFEVKRTYLDKEQLAVLYFFNYILIAQVKLILFSSSLVLITKIKRLLNCWIVTFVDFPTKLKKSVSEEFRKLMCYVFIFLHFRFFSIKKLKEEEEEEEKKGPLWTIRSTWER